MHRLLPLGLIALSVLVIVGVAQAQSERAVELSRQGDQLAQGGRLEEALSSYRQAIGMDFNYTGAYDGLCRVLFTLQRYEEAERMLRIAIRDNPTYATGWRNLAYALRKRGQGEQAVNAYNKAIQLRPADPDLYYGLGLAYLSLGQRASADMALREYVRREQRPSRQSWVQAAQAALAKLDAPAVEQPRARPNSPALSGTETAPDVIVSPPMPALPAAPDGTPSDRLRAQGDTLARAGKLPQALQAYEQAVRIDPFSLVAYDGLAYCAFRLGLYREGARRLSTALRDNRDYLRAWLHQARLLRAGGERAEAVVAYRRYLKERSNDVGVQLELARTLRSLGMAAQAIEAYQVILRRSSAPSEQAIRAAAQAELHLLGATSP